MSTKHHHTTKHKHDGEQLEETTTSAVVDELQPGDAPHWCDRCGAVLCSSRRARAARAELVRGLLNEIRPEFSVHILNDDAPDEPT